MGQPITTTEGICFAFPDVCITLLGSSKIPVPYANIGLLSEAQGVASSVQVGGKPVVTSNSEIPNTTGDEAGSEGGVISETSQGKVVFKTYSQTVKAEGGHVVRMFDTTEQNTSDKGGNAVGMVLGGVTNVLVGG